MVHGVGATTHIFNPSCGFTKKITLTTVYRLECRFIPASWPWPCGLGLVTLALWAWPAGVDLLDGTNKEQLCHIVAAASSWQKGRCAGPGGRAHRRGTPTQLLGDPKQAKDTPNAARRGAETQERWHPQEFKAQRWSPIFCVCKSTQKSRGCYGRRYSAWGGPRVAGMTTIEKEEKTGVK